MITGPLFKWFGSKWSLSKHYPPPIHDDIIEPFAGSAGYSLRHHPKRVHLYDANQQIRDLWSFLIRATESDIREIPINVPVGSDIRELGLSHGQALLLKMWQRTNNVGECWTISPWGHLPGQWTESTRARVAEQHLAIAHWRVLDNEWCGVNRTWFVDPPYQYGYQYRCNPIDYNQLADDVKYIARDNQVIVCEAMAKDGRCPDWLHFTPFRKQVTSRRKAENHHHSSELIYIS